MSFSNKTKTMLCVALAGLFFIPVIIFNIWYFAIIAAFFDWLPLPTGWMKMERNKNKKMVILHVILTLIAYSFLVLWLILPIVVYKFLFMEIWWMAVIAGVFITK